MPLRIWWTLEEQITRDADSVLNWLEEAGLWQAPLFTAHLGARIAQRLAADRGDTPSFTRLDPDANWKAYAEHPRVLMPGGKGDYTDWQTNDTPQIRDRNLTRAARLLEMAPASQRDRLATGVRAGLEEGAAPERLPDRLVALIGPWRPGQLQAAAANRSERGREAFETYCAPCHQSDGGGMERLAAPLRRSPLVLGREDSLIRVALQGLKGELLMPAMGTLDDQQLAAILTYIRTAWGHAAGADCRRDGGACARRVREADESLDSRRTGASGTCFDSAALNRPAGHRRRFGMAASGVGGTFWTTPFSRTSRSMSSSSIGRKSVKFSKPVSVTTIVSSYRR